MFGRLRPSQPYGDASVGLTSSEQSVAGLILPSISTLNVYSGTSPFPVDELRTRLTAVIRANPWLTSRLVKAVTRCDMRYKSQPTDDECSMYLIERTVKKLPVNPCTVEGRAEFTAVATALSSLLIPMGQQCVGNLEQQQLRVVVLRDDDGRSGLLFTMSHILADGYTFYSILRQLDSTQPVVALNALRSETSVGAMDRAFDANWLKSTPTTIGLVISLVRNAIVSKLSRPTHTQSFYALNDEAVRRVKQEAMSRVSSSSVDSAPIASSAASAVAVTYISTHDIVASRFFCIASQPANLVAINCRDRIPHITTAMAGNYEALLVYPPTDTQYPEQIRRSIITQRCESNRPPAMWAMLSGIGLVTDWASFYHELEVKGLVLEAHMPFFAPTTLNCGSTCVLFRLKGQQRAVMTNMPNAFDLNWQHEAGIIDSCAG